MCWQNSVDLIIAASTRCQLTHMQQQQIHMGIQPQWTLTRDISRHWAETSSILVKHLQLACNLLC